MTLQLHSDLRELIKTMGWLNCNSITNSCTMMIYEIDEPRNYSNYGLVNDDSNSNSCIMVI